MWVCGTHSSRVWAECVVFHTHTRVPLRHTHTRVCVVFARVGVESSMCAFGKAHARHTRVLLESVCHTRVAHTFERHTRVPHACGFEIVCHMQSINDHNSQFTDGIELKFSGLASLT